LTGLSVEEFDRLMETFAPACEAFLEKYTFDGKKRFHRYSPRGGKLTNIQEKLFFILIYYKNNFLQEAQAAIFGMKQDMCNKGIKVLHLFCSNPSRTSPLKNTSKTFHRKKPYSWTRPSARFNDPRRSNWSITVAKKSDIPSNILVLASVAGLILWVGATFSGKVHEKNLADTTRFPTRWHIKADLGFYGMQHTHPGVNLPHKKPGAPIRPKRKWKKTAPCFPSGSKSNTPSRASKRGELSRISIEIIKKASGMKPLSSLAHCTTSGSPPKGIIRKL
jgi:hypothetical protein